MTLDGHVKTVTDSLDVFRARVKDEVASLKTCKDARGAEGMDVLVLRRAVAAYEILRSNLALASSSVTAAEAQTDEAEEAFTNLVRTAISPLLAQKGAKARPLPAVPKRVPLPQQLLDWGGGVAVAQQPSIEAEDFPCDASCASSVEQAQQQVGPCDASCECHASSGRIRINDDAWHENINPKP